MAGPLEKVTAGTPLRRFRAPTYNRFVDAALIAERIDRQRLSPTSPQFRQTGIIKVQNLSGEKRGRFDILGIDEPIIGPSDSLQNWQNQVQFKGLLPDIAEHEGKFVVLLDPLRQEGVGRAFISGACSCRVDVTNDEFHQFADLDDGEAGRLKSGAWGAAFMIWREGGTGEQWADILLSPGLPIAPEITFQLDSVLNTGDPTAEVSVNNYRWGTDPDPDSEGLTIENQLGFEGTQGAPGYARWHGEAYYIWQLPCGA